jgi:hypothetical protein
MATYRDAPDIGMPPPAHTLTPSAEFARRSFADWAAGNPVVLVDGKPKRVPLESVADPDLVTEHLPVWHNESGMLLKGAPRAFYDAALAAGCAVEVIVAGKAVEVRVDRGRIRAWWTGGRTSGAVIEHRKKITVAVAFHALTMTLEDAERTDREHREELARKRAAKAAA